MKSGIRLSYSAMNRSLRNHLLIGLFALVLAGIQAVKDSPWHDHGDHVADCAICHLQFSDTTVTGASVAPPPARLLRISVPRPAPAHRSRFPSPFQGRGPPRPL